MNIKKRLLPAALIVIVTFGCILLSRPTRVLFFVALAILSAFELEHVLRAADVPFEKWFAIAYAVCQGVLCLAGASAAGLIALFALFAFAVFFYVILRPSLGGGYVAGNLFALLWPFGFYGIVISAAASAAWAQVLVIAILGTWACDSMALIGGKAFGKRKLAPQVSPNKTWEGAVIGGVCAAVAGVLIALVLKKPAPVPMGVCVLTAFAASCFGQVGDLAASLMKRMAGVKDYGHLMPEHGGIMDKMDSMLFAIPAAYFLLVLFGVA